ncbi:hypothetical protein BU52_05575 [Streptomyces toyocaensis]|uniref:DUF4232 domain-containing protein n=1 Tax=Streptomyces toyocaensis TaxID=55952 RepID=A0A081XWH5_STRTO|nr:DUF4232 domain-containing protein [Streptomyces toyocaensis]KES07898.1 hypothetical protein BU52_05575 [Streptomyces toyocaensis]
MRTSRLRLLAAAGITLAALSLTACQDGTGTKDEGASRPNATASAGTPTNTPTEAPSAPPADGTGPSRPSPAGADTGGGRSGGKDTHRGADRGTGTSGGSGDPQTRVACNGSNTTVTARPVPRPLNHMLITVRNTGSKPCDLTYYPVLRFDEMQWVPQPVEASKPQAVVGIDPGRSAYAGVLLSAADGSGDGGTTGRALTVGFQGHTPNSSGGPAATPSLPAKGVYYDSTLTVTYWQQSMDDALTY